MLALAVWLFGGSALAQYDPELGDVGEDAPEAAAEPPAPESPQAVEAEAEAEPAAPAVEAGPKLGTEGRFGLGLDLVLLELDRRTNSAEGFQDQDISLLTYGLVPSRAGLALGYGISSRMVLGARVSLSIGSVDNDGDESSSLGWGVSPFLEYTLLPDPGETFTLQALVRLGVNGSSSSDEDGADSRVLIFLGGLGVGARVQVAPWASFGSRVELAYGLGSGEEPQGNSTIEYDVSGLLVSWYFGFTVWV